MQVSLPQFLTKVRRCSRVCLSLVGMGLRVLLLLTLLMTSARDARPSPVLASMDWETEESNTESEGPADSEQPSKGGTEVVPPRQRGERLTGRAAPLPFLLPRMTVCISDGAASPRFVKLLPGGRHADRNGLGAPLLC